MNVIPMALAYLSSISSTSFLIFFSHSTVEPRISFNEITVHWAFLGIAIDAFPTVDDGIPLLNLFNCVTDDLAPSVTAVFLAVILFTPGTPFKGLFVFLDFFQGEYRHCYGFTYKLPPGELFSHHFFHESYGFFCFHNYLATTFMMLDLQSFNTESSSMLMFLPFPFLMMMMQSPNALNVS